MRHEVRILLLLFMAGCAAPRETPDWSDCPRLAATSADRWPLPAERPLELTFTRPVRTDQDAGVFLVPQEDGGPCNPACPVPCAAGRCFLSAVDATFLADATGGELSASRRRKTEELVVEAAAAGWRVRPRWGALRPSWRYDLVLTPKVRDDRGLPLLDPEGRAAAFAVPFETARADDLEAVITQLAPTPGARVPQNLAFIALRLSGTGGEAAGTFVLMTEDRRVLELAATTLPAACVGAPPGASCLALWIPETLAPDTVHELRIVRRVRLSDGRYLLPWSRLASFRTGELDWLYPPRWEPEAPEEVTGCVHLGGTLVGEGLVWLEADGAPVCGATLVRFGRAELGVRGATDMVARVRVLGLDGTVLAEEPVAVPAVSGEAHPVAIVRVHPNPVGPEPAQEFLELENVSGAPVELEGWELTDDPEKAGDLLPAFTLEPGARVRVAGKGHDPFFAGEPPAEGDVLVLASSLANAGLGNGGEPLYLFDAFGYLVSRYGGWIDTGKAPGLSVRRAAPTACDVPANWELR